MSTSIASASFADVHPHDRLALVATYSDTLRILARSLGSVGRGDLQPILLEVAAEMQSLAHEIVWERKGLEILHRASRLVEASESLITRILATSASRH
jgi:hypothetical protein